MQRRNTAHGQQQPRRPSSPQARQAVPSHRPFTVRLVIATWSCGMSMCMRVGRQDGVPLDTTHTYTPSAALTPARYCVIASVMRLSAGCTTSCVQRMHRPYGDVTLAHSLQVHSKGPSSTQIHFTSLSGTACMPCRRSSSDPWFATAWVLLHAVQLRSGATGGQRQSLKARHTHRGGSLPPAASIQCNTSTMACRLARSAAWPCPALGRSRP